MPWRTLKLILIENCRQSATEIVSVQVFKTVFCFFSLFFFFSFIFTYLFSPKLTVIVVKKRVNTRFFAQSGGGLKNPPPGTVVDVEVTRPEW